jgi:hypothetical protein
MCLRAWHDARCHPQWLAVGSPRSLATPSARIGNRDHAQGRRLLSPRPPACPASRTAGLRPAYPAGSSARGGRQDEPQQVHRHARLATGRASSGPSRPRAVRSGRCRTCRATMPQVVEHVPGEVELGEIHVPVDRAQDAGGAQEPVVAARMNRVEPVAQVLGARDLQHDRGRGRDAMAMAPSFSTTSSPPPATPMLMTGVSIRSASWAG